MRISLTNTSLITGGGEEHVQTNAFNWENFGFGNKNTAYRRPEFTLVFFAS